MDNGDSFKKVRSGEPMMIPASTWNALLDALAWVNQQRKMQASGRDVIDQRCVLVRNDSGSNLPAQCVLGVSGVVFDPAAGGNPLASFKADPVLIGDLPSVADHAGKFVILAAPINDGEIGFAWASGTCAAKVHITDATHQFADVSDGGVGYLDSGDTGAATILWKQASTGTVWCVVRFGGGGGAAGEDPPVGTCATPLTIPAGSGATAESTPWDRTNQGSRDGVIVTKQTREYYDATAHVLYYFTRDFKYDSLGDLVTISAETRHTTDTLVNCNQ